MMREKKVLICEDDLKAVNDLKYFLSESGYNPVDLYKEEDPQYVVNNLESTLNSENPDCVITDGLNGLCFKVLEIAKGYNPDLPVLIYSGTHNLVTKSNEKGNPAIDKDIGGPMNISNYLNKIFEEQD